MSLLRIKELEQQLERRDERLAQIEANISKLQFYIADIKYDGVLDENTPVMLKDNRGDFFKSGDVWNCFK